LAYGGCFSAGTASAVRLLRDGLVDASLFGIYAMSDSRANNCVQATPDCAFLFIIGQVSGAPKGVS
jgi:hypothetical protein